MRDLTQLRSLHLLAQISNFDTADFRSNSIICERLPTNAYSWSILFNRMSSALTAICQQMLIENQRFSGNRPPARKAVVDAATAGRGGVVLPLGGADKAGTLLAGYFVCGQAPCGMHAIVRQLFRLLDRG